MPTKMQLHLQIAKQSIGGHSLGYKAKIAMGMMLLFLDQQNYGIDPDEEELKTTNDFKLKDFQGFITNLIEKDCI